VSGFRGERPLRALFFHIQFAPIGLSGTADRSFRNIHIGLSGTLYRSIRNAPIF